MAIDSDPTDAAHAASRRALASDLGVVAGVGAALVIAAFIAGAIGAGATIGGVLALAATAGWRFATSRAAPRTPRAPAVNRASTDADLDRAAARLFARSPNPELVIGSRGRLAAANAAATAMLSPRVGEHISASLRIPELLAAIDRVLDGGPAETIEVVRHTPVEQTFAARIDRLFPESSPKAGAPSVFVVLNDISAIKQVDRMRADFVAHASHELRTPLAAVSGFIETLQGPARDDPEARDRFLEVMAGQAQRMSRLISDLLSLSRIELNEHAAPVDTVDIGEIAREVVAALAPIAQQRGVTIAMDLPAGVRVTGDRDELSQVLLNLVDNAIKYGDDGGVVRIARRGDSRSGRVAIAVSDTGPGIAREHIPRLTERFYRVDPAASRSRGGTGLGLAIVKHIVARHRGDLRIESAAGDGSTFTVELPEAVVT